MRDTMREKLNTEITRKQFLQFMAAAVLTVFGLNNILALLGGNRDIHQVLVPGAANTDNNSFGTRKFGV
jgi:hypothetical protein